MARLEAKIGKVTPKGNLALLQGGAVNRTPPIRSLYEFAAWLQGESRLSGRVHGFYVVAWDRHRHAAGWAFIGDEGVTPADLPAFAAEYARILMAG
jgi:hypothetical protein